MKIKEPSVAGSFYPDNSLEIKNFIELFEKTNKNHYTYETRAVIVPHAGWIYSGRLAFEGISQIDRKVKNIFIFGPAHRVYTKGIAISSFDTWKTPVGMIDINKSIYQELLNNFNAKINDNALQPEHSIEVELPIIQHFFQNIKIIPILIGDTEPSTITNIIEHYYKNPENAFVISSDLSHFLTDEEAKKTDIKTAQMIEGKEQNRFTCEQACGYVAIEGLKQFTQNHNYSLIRIDMANSSKISNDKTSVVGYGTWFMFEGDKNEYIKQHYSNFVIELCRNTLRSAFDNKSLSDQQHTLLEYPQIFDQLGASFITINKNHKLRGCIGSISEYRPLITDIIEHTLDAGFKDNRFMPLQKEELPDLKYSISILSSPKNIIFKDEQDLLSQIVPNKDGIIIKDGKYQSVYLPCVWEQLPNKKEFMSSLKEKAGLPADYFSNTMAVFKFSTTYIQEN